MSRPVTYTASTAPLGGRSRRRSKPPCPCCGQPGGLCESHKARLAPIKELVNPGTLAFTIPGRRKPGGRRGVPVCVNPACGEQRVPPAAFCDECQRAGFVEEND